MISEVNVDNHALAHVPLDLRIDLLRIIQEAVTNIIKHTRTQRISVLAYREDHVLLLSVADDGKGKQSGKSLGRAIRG